MTRRRALPPALPVRFAVADALERGVTPARLRASDLHTPFRGVRTFLLPTIEGDEWARARAELIERCRAYLTVGPADAVFSHVTAARLHGIPVPRALRSRPELDVSTGSGIQPRMRGVIGHRVTCRAVTVEGLPVAAPEIAWLQLAAALTVDELVVAGDFLVRRKRPTSRLERLRAEVAAAGSPRGIVTARAALADIRAGTDSPPESWMRLELVRAGLPEPAIRHTVHDRDGFFVGTPDLAYVDQRIAIEYEGEIHRTDVTVFEQDIERRELFERADWRVVRVRGRHLEMRGQLAARIRPILAERARAPEL